MVRWAMNQPYERLIARSEQHRNPTFGQFIGDPNGERGKLFQMDIHLRRVVKYDVQMKLHDEDGPQQAVQLYEMWGYTDESRNHLYQFIIYDPPAGMPIAGDVREEVHCVGYFFRIQGYEAPRMANKRLFAPSFIGRVAWKARGPSAAVGAAEWPFFIILAGGAALVACIYVGFVVFRSRRSVAEITTDMPIPASITIDDWLDEASEQESFDEEGSAEGNGHFGEGTGNGHSPGFSGLYFKHPHENN